LNAEFLRNRPKNKVGEDIRSLTELAPPQLTRKVTQNCTRAECWSPCSVPKSDLFQRRTIATRTVISGETSASMETRSDKRPDRPIRPNLQHSLLFSLIAERGSSSTKSTNSYFMFRSARTETNSGSAPMPPWRSQRPRRATHPRLYNRNASSVTSDPIGGNKHNPELSQSQLSASTRIGRFHRGSLFHPLDTLYASFFSFRRQPMPTWPRNGTANPCELRMLFRAPVKPSRIIRAKLSRVISAPHFLLYSLRRCGIRIPAHIGARSRRQPALIPRHFVGAAR
jgi:hypothetical protein